MCFPTAVALDPSNNVYIGDYNNSRAVEFNETTNATTAPTNATANLVFGTGNNLDRRGKLLLPDQPGVCYPFGMAIDSAANLFDSQLRER